MMNILVIFNIDLPANMICALHYMNKYNTKYITFKMLVHILIFWILK